MNVCKCAERRTNDGRKDKLHQRGLKGELGTRNERYTKKNPRPHLVSLNMCACVLFTVGCIFVAWTQGTRIMRTSSSFIRFSFYFPAFLFSFPIFIRKKNALSSLPFLFFPRQNRVNNAWYKVVVVAFMWWECGKVVEPLRSWYPLVLFRWPLH